MEKTVPTLTEKETMLLEVMQAEHAVALQCSAPSSKFPTLSSFVVEYGRAWTLQPLPKHVKRGRMRECFMNAFHTVERHEFDPEPFYYCEGFALPAPCSAGGVSFPVHHAWVVKADGTGYDPTWHGRGWDKGTVYYGIPFSMRFLQRTIRRTKLYGVLGGGNVASLQMLRRWAKNGLPKDAVVKLSRA